MIYAFFLGLLLIYMYEKCKNLSSLIFLHMGLNVAAIFWYALQDVLDINIMIVFLCFCLTFLGFVIKYYVKAVIKNDSNEDKCGSNAS